MGIKCFLGRHKWIRDYHFRHKSGALVFRCSSCGVMKDREGKDDNGMEVEIPARTEEPKVKKDFFKRMVKQFVETKKRKIKHRRRGERHGKSLREARKMGVAE